MYNAGHRLEKSQRENRLEKQQQQDRTEQRTYPGKGRGRH